MALHFECCPIELDSEQVLDYLHYLKNQHKTPSDSFFKHTVYGLRYLYRVYGMDHLRIQLPAIERPKKLPVILSQSEIKILLKTPVLLKHRLLLALLYGCGLRCFELRNLKIKDISFERKLLHVRNGKGRKDRYVPIDELLVGGIKKYIAVVHPRDWLFNGNDRSGNLVGLSQTGVQWVVKQARKKSGINKQITAHTLRHSYATHLLEMGLDMVSLKEVLGHADIQTTMVYLHVSNLGRQAAFSPLERLYKIRE